MNVSVTLTVEDVQFLDAYVKDNGLASRSEALHRAVRVLRAAGLADAYEAAWEEWSAHGSSGLWEAATSEGLGH